LTKCSRSENGACGLCEAQIRSGRACRQHAIPAARNRRLQRAACLRRTGADQCCGCKDCRAEREWARRGTNEMSTSSLVRGCRRSSCASHVFLPPLPLTERRPPRDPLRSLLSAALFASPGDEVGSVAAAVARRGQRQLRVPGETLGRIECGRRAHAESRKLVPSNEGCQATQALLQRKQGLDSGRGMPMTVQECPLLAESGLERLISWAVALAARGGLPVGRRAHPRDAARGRARERTLARPLWLPGEDGSANPALRGQRLHRPAPPQSSEIVEPALTRREATDISALLQRGGRGRCPRCAQPIEPGLLALAAIMCAACRGRHTRRSVRR
jgi:hypothetical protein